MKLFSLYYECIFHNLDKQLQSYEKCIQCTLKFQHEMETIRCAQIHTKALRHPHIDLYSTVIHMEVIQHRLHITTALLEYYLAGLTGDGYEIFLNLYCAIDVPIFFFVL